MIPRKAAEGIAILSGIGGFLCYLALHVAARGLASLRRRKNVPTRGQPPPRLPSAKPAEEQPSPAAQRTVAPQETPVIPQSTPSYWQERDNHRLVGTYQTPSSAYSGYITNCQSPRREFFIIYPPQSLRDHSQGNQLIHRGNGRFLIRFTSKPACAGDGIRAIEQLLVEAEVAETSSVQSKVHAAETEKIVVEPVKRDWIEIHPIARTQVVVEPKYRPYWQMQDWTPDGDRLIGEYKTPLGSFVGYVNNYRSRRPQFFIVNPPKQLSRHPHHACFQRKGNGHSWVHFGTKPRNPDSGIREIERYSQRLSASKGDKHETHYEQEQSQ
jgi:hypothetical protein